MNEDIEVAWSDPESDIDMLLAEIPEGYKVQVKRTEPDWCVGVVVTRDYDPTDPVSAKWIVNRFGGRKYQIKVLDERGRYKHIRSITFPDPPLKDGAPIVPGPNGSYIFATEARVLDAQPAPPAQHGDGMSGLFTTMLEMQTQQANQMQTLMMTLLSKTLDSNNNAPAPVVPPPVAVNPQAHMKDTLEMFKTMEELRGMMSGDDKAEGDSENPLLDIVINKAVEKLTGPPAQPPQQKPNLPPGPIAPARSNMDFALEAKERLKTMSEQERELLLSHVFEEDDEETPVVSGHEDDPEVESLLTKEDQETLGDEPPHQENEGETI